MKIGGCCLLFLLCLSVQSVAQNKSAFDLHEDASADFGQGSATTAQHGGQADAASLRKGAAEGLERTALMNPFTAVTLLRGGYFTLGTTGGASAEQLDDYNQITFGHPFALTSFVLLYWDGAWYRPEQFFTREEQDLYGYNDTIRLVCERPGLCRLDFRIVQDAANGRLRLSATLRNLDAAAHEAAVAFQLDAALGRSGDAALYADGTLIQRDTVLQAGAPLLLQERAGAARMGLRAAFDFPGLAPQGIVVENWQPALGPVFDPREARPRQLFDLVLRPEWSRTSLQTDAATIAELIMDLPAPDFSGPAFMRWDMPTGLSIDRGALFPHDLSVLVQTWNAATTPFAYTRIRAPFADELIVGSRDQWNVSAQGQDFGFTTLSFLSTEVFEETVVPVTIRCVTQEGTLDSLTRWVYIPAVAMADEGLTVDIDTVDLGALPEVDVYFGIQDEASQVPILGARAEHLWLFENGERIRDFTVRREALGEVAAVDVVFVLDVTGSMAEEIAGVRDNIIAFAEALSGVGINFRLGMVTFGDEIRGIFPFTSSVLAFQTEVGKQRATGGGDSPENSLEALYQASILPFRQEAHRVIVWITDANFYEGNSRCRHTTNSIVTAMLGQAAVVHAIGAEYAREMYQRITTPTGGSYFDITGNFKDILLQISNFNVSTVYRLHYRTPAPSADPRLIELEVHYAGKGGSASWRSQAPAIETAPVEMLCYPNPFNPSVSIRLRNVEGGTGHLSVTDAAGREVQRYVVDGTRGSYQFEWNAGAKGATASGVYFIRLQLAREGGSLLQKTVTVIHAK